MACVELATRAWVGVRGRVLPLDFYAGVAYAYVSSTPASNGTVVLRRLDPAVKWRVEEVLVWAGARRSGIYVAGAGARRFKEAVDVVVASGAAPAVFLDGMAYGAASILSARGRLQLYFTSARAAVAAREALAARGMRLSLYGSKLVGGAVVEARAREATG